MCDPGFEAPVEQRLCWEAEEEMMFSMWSLALEKHAGFLWKLQRC